MDIIVADGLEARARDCAQHAREAQLRQAAAEYAAGMRATATFTVLAAVQRDGLRAVCLAWGVELVADGYNVWAREQGSAASEAERDFGASAADFVESTLVELAGVRRG